MHNVSEYAVFTNSRGASVRFELVSIEGLGDVEADIQQQRAPFQDGSTYIDAVLEPRYIETEFLVRGVDYGEVRANRAALASVINPKLGLGTLKYVSGDTERMIEAVAETVPFYPDKENRSERWQRGIVTFVAPNPYWKSPTIIEEPMAAFVELLEFPSDEYWEVGDDGDLYFEVGFEGEKRNFKITGDAVVPIEITFNGSLLNPTLRNNTTGQMIRVNRRIEIGDVLTINTEDSTVLLNGENVFHWIDPESTFWKLQVGENEIEYFADEGIETANLELRWQEHYVAV